MSMKDEVVVCLDCGAEIPPDYTKSHFDIDHADLDYERGAAVYVPKESAD
jgi:hypothetical protein